MAEIVLRRFGVDYT
nr:hypothetical protein [Streptomyces sp. RB17]